jgi:hypothetical protein
MKKRARLRDACSWRTLPARIVRCVIEDGLDVSFLLAPSNLQAAHQRCNELTSNRPDSSAGSDASGEEGRCLRCPAEPLRHVGDVTIDREGTPPRYLTKRSPSAAATPGGWGARRPCDQGTQVRERPAQFSDERLLGPNATSTLLNEDVIATSRAEARGSQRPVTTISGGWGTASV